MSGSKDIVIEQLRAEVARLECVVSLRGDVIERYEAETARLRAALDARPDISAEDAAHAVQFFRGWDAPGSVTDKVFAALRAHAAKVVKP